LRKWPENISRGVLLLLAFDWWSRCSGHYIGVAWKEHQKQRFCKKMYQGCNIPSNSPDSKLWKLV